MSYDWGYVIRKAVDRALFRAPSSSLIGGRTPSSSSGGGGGGFGLGGVVSGLMNTINSTADIAKNYSQQTMLSGSQAPDNPIDRLRQQLYQAMNAPLDTAGLRSSASKQASGIYGPQIEALRQLSEQSQREAVKNKAEIGRMFESLSRGITADIPLIEKNTKQGKREVEKQYDQSQTDTDQLYKSIEKQQTNEMERLGIQAAAPDVIPGQNRDRAFYQQLAESGKRQTTDYLDIIGQGSEEFTREGAQLARTEGTQRKADIGQQLAQILFGNRQAIGQLRGEQRSAVEQIYNQLVGGAQQQQQQKVGNINSLINLEQEERGFAVGQQHYTQEQAYRQQKDAANQSKSSYSGLRGAAQVALDYFSNQPAQAQKVTSWVNNYLLSQGTYQIRPGERFDPMTVAQKAYQAAAKAGFQGGSLNAIRDAVLAYYGKY